MFKEGEKVVCINDGILEEIQKRNRRFPTKPPTNKIKKHVVYTIKSILLNGDILIIEEVPGIMFDYRRFISLVNHRKEKLEKINIKYV